MLPDATGACARDGGDADGVSGAGAWPVWGVAGLGLAGLGVAGLGVNIQGVTGSVSNWRAMVISCMFEVPS